MEDDENRTITLPDGCYRDSLNDYVYYNSDLSKWIGKELPRVMTNINIDIAQYKKSKGIIRFCESKHNNEHIGYQQQQLLDELAQIAKFVNDSNYRNKDGKKITLEVCLVRGDYPFAQINVCDYVTNSSTMLTGEDVKKYLTLE